MGRQIKRLSTGAVKRNKLITGINILWSLLCLVGHIINFYILATKENYPFLWKGLAVWTAITVIGCLVSWIIHLFIIKPTD